MSSTVQIVPCSCHMTCGAWLSGIQYLYPHCAGWGCTQGTTPVIDDVLHTAITSVNLSARQALVSQQGEKSFDTCRSTLYRSRPWGRGISARTRQAEATESLRLPEPVLRGQPRSSCRAWWAVCGASAEIAWQWLHHWQASALSRGHAGRAMPQVLRISCIQQHRC